MLRTKPVPVFALPGFDPDARRSFAMPINARALEVGDTVYGSFGQFGSINVKAGTIRKKTPTGQLCADFGEKWPGNGKARERRFNKSGWEIGGNASYAGMLIDEETF